MPNYIKKIEIIGLHNRFDIHQEFQSGINIIHAPNGAGKTSLIHCIVNILNGDYSHFLHIQFFRIKVWFDDNNLVTIYNENYELNKEPCIRVCLNYDRRGIIITEQINELHQLKDISDDSEENLNDTDKNNLYKQDYTQNKVLLSTAYFPAFRTMIEGWELVEQNLTKDKINSFAKKMFGNFVPELNYPSPKNVEQGLINQIQVITNELAQIDRELMSRISVDYLSASLENKFNFNIVSFESIIEEIKSLFQDLKKFPIPDITYISSTEIYINILEKISSNIITAENTREFIGFLRIYQNSLKLLLKTAKDKFYYFDKYLLAVNNFLEDKDIEIVNLANQENSPVVRIRFHDDSISNGLGALSSGERQIITIMYAATYMSQEKLILIDEPEISLHIDWQRKFIKKMSEQLSEVQIIACTHSPMLAADYKGYLKELHSKYTDKNLWGLDDAIDENGIAKLKDNNKNDFDQYDFIDDEQETY